MKFLKKIIKMKNLFIIPLVLLFLRCGSKETKVESTETAPLIESMKVSLTTAQFDNAGIVLGKPEKREISEILKLNGKIDVPPQNLVSVSIPMGGYLKTTDLLPGMVVRKGQVIATLEDQQYVQLQQDYLLIKVKLKTVEAEYFRQKELNASKASSDKVFQQAEAEFKNARINLKALDQNLQIIGINPDRLDESKISKRISIFSPIDGYVAKVNANIGKYLTPSEVLFELVNVADIHLNLRVFEKDLSKLAIGQKLVAFNNNDPDKKYPCEILLIGHSLTAEKNTEVHCHFKKYDNSLVPGMYMNAEIELKNVNAITVPEESVVRFGNFEYIFVELKKNQFEMIEIKTGAKENGYVEILNNEKLDNQTIVIKGAYSLLMKLKNSEGE
jgi:cobalt-zinc-cadmium efflux system membrane fusion protein